MPGNQFLEIAGETNCIYLIRLSIKRMRCIDNDTLPVYKGSSIVQCVGRKHCLYKMCYALWPGVSVYFIIDDTRYLCSSHVQTCSVRCKKYDKNVKYLKFDGSNWSRGDWKNPYDIWFYHKWKRCEEEWIVPFEIRLIDTRIRNRTCYGYGDGIDIYRAGKEIEEYINPRRMHSRIRKRKINLYGSDNFLNNM